MATDPRPEHWPKRDERHAAYLAVIPLTDPAVFIAHCTANDFFSQMQSSDRHTALHARDMLRHLEEQRKASAR